MISNNDRLVLVRPQGGLNDTLMQIEKCCEYAERTKRKVIVDTNYKSSTTFHENFSNYFRSLEPSLILDTSEVNLDAETSVFPNQLSGRLNNYQLYDGFTDKLYRDLQSMQPITFDFSQEYSQRVVVHQQLGGGDSSNFFHRVTLLGGPRDELSKRLERLGPNFIGVHIRNTDYRTNFRGFIDEGIRREHFSNKKVFLATDSKEALFYFKENVRDALYLETTEADFSGNIPIHNRRISDPLYWKRNNASAILDLLTLAYSDSISAPPLLNYFRDGKHMKSIQFSGFVKLALALKNKRVLLTRFTGIECRSGS